MKIYLRFLILTQLFFFLSISAHSNEKNLNITASGDIIAPFSSDDASNNKVGVRSTEVILYAPIDHLFDGMINLAGHTDEGVFKFELHEGYLGSSKLIPQSRFRIGKFFLNAGRLNTFHQHDWPFISAPKVHREFFNPGIENAIQAEGAADTGVEYSWILPTEIYVDLTFGVTNGYCFGHCHTEGSKPAYPLYYLHPTTFFDFGSGKGLLTGATYLNRIDSSDLKTQLYGLEATYKNRVGKRLIWLWQNEIFYQTQSTEISATVKKAGFYTYPQFGVSDRLSLGFRFDGFSELSLEFDSNNQKRDDFDYAIVPTLTFKPSEFSTFRLAYSHEVNTTQGIDDTYDRQVQLQFGFILGAHPAHDF
jgi:hypothetical protein